AWLTKLPLQRRLWVGVVAARSAPSTQRELASRSVAAWRRELSTDKAGLSRYNTLAELSRLRQIGHDAHGWKGDAQGMRATRVAVLRQIAHRRALARSTIWRDALVAWVGQRFVLLTLVWLWRSLAGSSVTPATLFRLSATLWDSRLYAEIARGGYQ